MKARTLGTPQEKKPADAAVAKLLHNVLHEALTKKGKTRRQIADELASLVGTKVSVHMLNGFTAPTKGYRRIPAAWIPAVCEITGDDRLQRLLLAEPLCTLLQLGESALKAIEKSRAVLDAENCISRRPQSKRVESYFSTVTKRFDGAAETKARAKTR